MKNLTVESLIKRLEHYPKDYNVRAVYYKDDKELQLRLDTTAADGNKNEVIIYFDNLLELL